MMSQLTDEDIVKANTPIYDALYDNFKVHGIVKRSGQTIPKNNALGPTLATQYLRNVLKENP